MHAALTPTSVLTSASPKLRSDSRCAPRRQKLAGEVAMVPSGKASFSLSNGQTSQQRYPNATGSQTFPIV
jgi:hypothetical protein